MTHSSEGQAVVAEDVPINSVQEGNGKNDNSGNNTSRKGKGFSKLGFVLATAGAAVGLGNIWRFPIQVHEYGGGAFVLMCLLFAALLGGVLLILEIAIGRRAGQGVFGAFRQLCKKFWWLGLLATLVPFLVLCYYNVIGGWTLYYAVYYITYGMGNGFDAFDPTKNPDGSKNLYNNFLGIGNGSFGYVAIVFTLIFIAIILFIVLLGVQKGIEKVSKIIMPVLAVFIVFVAIYTLCQKHAWEGVKHFFIPDFKRFFGMVNENGVATGMFSMKGMLAAITQVFYSLSVGSASLITYGSYMQKKESISKATTQIIVFDSAISILAGLIIIPGLFILGGGVAVASEGGSHLLFVQLPQLFYKTGGAWGSLIFGGLFFTLVFFAALSSTIAMLEAVVDGFMDLFKMTRKKAVIISGIFYALLAMVICFGHAFEWRGLPMVDGKDNNGVTVWTNMNIDDTIDFVASTLIVCVVSFLTCVAASWCSDFTRIQDEVGYKKKWSRGFYKIMIKYVAPLLIMVILVWGVLSTFVAFD